MQQLKERRIINTPTDIPHVRSNCGTVLNSLFKVSDSVQYLKTSFNNSDADLTPKEQGEQNLRVSVVYVLNHLKHSYGKGRAIPPPSEGRGFLVGNWDDK